MEGSSAGDDDMMGRVFSREKKMKEICTELPTGFNLKMWNSRFMIYQTGAPHCRFASSRQNTKKRENGLRFSGLWARR